MKEGDLADLVVLKKRPQREHEKDLAFERGVRALMKRTPFGRYAVAMDDLWPLLSPEERQAKLEWERTWNGDLPYRDMDWPGWVKYLGPPPKRIRTRELKRERAG